MVSKRSCASLFADLHLVIEHLGLARLGLGDQSLVEDIENILADLLELAFDLLTIVTDGTDMLVGALGLFLLLDGRDDSPGSTSCANYILVCDGEEIALIDSEFAAKLFGVSGPILAWWCACDVRLRPPSCS